MTKFNYDKVHTRTNYASGLNMAALEREKKLLEYLKELDDNKKFSKEIFELGKDFFNQGNVLENAPEEYMNNVSFVSGYNHAKRLAMIAEKERNRSR